ncbi:ABC transporter substrate-binding protein [Vreelandella titanicae]|uniref:ABC transporter substrate-binding protein n=1 Tax=Vreelandella titanicae TaxID=664683 RepID=A0A558JB15_9GAMM|nr:ABC transporter substrate-binding protein [Halomonas titanicae]TVU90801.1 ABC transporter substrate-binding protein [Halomonas titanicae]
MAFNIHYEAVHPLNTGVIVEYQNGTFCHYVRRKTTTLSGTLLISLLMSSVSMAGNENDEAPLATFDFAIAETLSAIGHPPRFLAGLKGYETYSRQEGVIPLATNLGSRFLPNYELLASHPPQHILISPPAHASLLPRLRKITDVMEYPLYNYADGDGDGNHSDWETIEALTRQLGTLVNDAAASEQYIEQTNRYFDDLKSQLSSVDEPVLMVRLVDERHARVYGKGSVEGMVLNRLGLQNAWQDDLGQWGMTTISATPLFSIDAKMIFLESPYDPPGGQRQLLADGQWRHLPTVKEGNYLIISTNYWSWGGLPAARHFADSLANHLIESAAPPAR